MDSIRKSSEQLAYTCWCLVHGMATLWIDGAATKAFPDRQSYEAAMGRIIDASARWSSPPGRR